MEAFRTTGRIFFGIRSVVALVFTLLTLVLLLPTGQARAEGELDTGFVGGPTLSGDVHTVLALPDGYALAGGAFSQVNSATDYQWLIRYTPGGALDSGYDPNMQFTVTSLLQQPDGLILAAGIFLNVNGTDQQRLARLNLNGSLDPTMASPAPDQSMMRVALGAGGGIYAGGPFETFGAIPRSRVAKFTSTGVIDSGFVPPVINSTVRTMAEQDDGKLVIGGAFSEVGAAPRGRIARLNASGSHDTDFTPPFLNSDVRDIVVLPDQKILVAGSFGNVDGNTARDALIRLHSNGNVDTTFQPLNITDGFGIVFDLETLDNGQMMIAGGFTGLGGVTYSRVARLNADGSVDPTFVPPAFNDILEAVDVYTDGKVLVGGRFTTVDGASRSKVARLLADPVVMPAPVLGIVGKVKTKPKKLRVGKAFKVQVRVKNTGEGPAAAVDVCAKLTKKVKKAIKPKGARKGCKKIALLAPGATGKVTLGFKTNKKRAKAGKAYKLAVSAVGDDVGNELKVSSQVVKVKAKFRK